MQGRELDCVRKLYPICKEGFWRTQTGDCFNSGQWSEYCTYQVRILLYTQYYADLVLELNDFHNLDVLN